MQEGDLKSGFLLIDKPKGISSFDCLRILKKKFNFSKIGHSGTLDPDATGLLIVGIGQSTKDLKNLIALSKTYRATICLGQKTDTADASGKVLESSQIVSKPSIAQIDKVLSSFWGDYQQIPPMYSALKFKGKKLYQYAREGKEIKREPRLLKIFSLKRLSDLRVENDKIYFDYEVHGSSGLYVRALSEDIGKKLNLPAHNFALKRLKIGQFDIKEATELEKLSQMSLIKQHLKKN